jgi:peptidoglycan hydrolase-like protein with peptidoglycan-binding domain
MGQRFKITEEEKKHIRKMYIVEQRVGSGSAMLDPLKLSQQLSQTNNKQNQVDPSVLNKVYEPGDHTSINPSTDNIPPKPIQNSANLSCVSPENFKNKDKNGSYFYYNTGSGWLFFYNDGTVRLTEKQTIQQMQDAGVKLLKQGKWGCDTNRIKYSFSDLPNDIKYMPLPGVTKNLDNSRCAQKIEDIQQSGKVLFMGCRTDAVKLLQKMLGLKDDGIFGNNTKSSVIKYQQSKGLKPDGIVGKETISNLFKDKGNLLSQGYYDDYEKYVLNKTRIQ